jgi:hypothetical protein
MGVDKETKEICMVCGRVGCDGGCEPITHGNCDCGGTIKETYYGMNVVLECDTCGMES